MSAVAARRSGGSLRSLVASYTKYSAVEPTTSEKWPLRQTPKLCICWVIIGTCQAHTASGEALN